MSNKLSLDVTTVISTICPLVWDDKQCDIQIQWDKSEGSKDKYRASMNFQTRTFFQMYNVLKPVSYSIFTALSGIKIQSPTPWDQLPFQYIEQRSSTDSAEWELACHLPNEIFKRVAICSLMCIYNTYQGSRKSIPDVLPNIYFSLNITYVSKLAVRSVTAVCRS